MHEPVKWYWIRAVIEKVILHTAYSDVSKDMSKEEGRCFTRWKLAEEIERSEAMPKCLSQTMPAILRGKIPSFLVHRLKTGRSALHLPNPGPASFTIPATAPWYLLGI